MRHAVLTGRWRVIIRLRRVIDLRGDGGRRGLWSAGVLISYRAGISDLVSDRGRGTDEPSLRIERYRSIRIDGVGTLAGYREHGRFTTGDSFRGTTQVECALRERHSTFSQVIAKYVDALVSVIGA